MYKISVITRGFIAPCFILLMLSMGGCGGGETPDPDTKATDFDRAKMLQFWADEIIVPAFKNYRTKIHGLYAATEDFSTKPGQPNLEKLRAAWLEAYTAWQSVAMFNIGKAEATHLRDFTDIYPSNVAEIEKNIQSGLYNLQLPSKYDEQGLPALDYLLYGLAETDEALLSKLSTKAYTQYLNDLTIRLQTLTDEVVADWEDSFKAKFIANKGSSASSSVDIIVNDYLYYYEKFLRAGKIAIPAGVISGDKLPGAVEAVYSKTKSKSLFLASLKAVEDFFNGKSFGETTTGTSLKAYLDYLKTKKDGENLSTTIGQQFGKVRTSAEALKDNFAEQVNTDNTKMLNVYDELQKNVVLIKVDAMQAMNIQVDYIDADGD